MPEPFPNEAAQRRPEPGARAGVPLLRLGFRPFYLLASVFAAVSVALWSAQYAGGMRAAYLAGPLWHAHEMLFGFTMAVVAGFLFTAVRNWTGRPTPTGAMLALIVLLWVAGRVLVSTPLGWASAVVNAAFPVAVAVGIGVPIIRAANRRNYFFIALLIALAVAVLMVHLSQLGVLDLPGWLGIQIALDVVLFVMTVMGGRVIPMFTNNAVPGVGARRLPQLERLVLGATLAVLAADALQASGALLLIVLVLACAAHATRLLLWMPWRTARVPLVWILHAAYAWIPLHLALRLLAEADWVPVPLATHALTVGAIGGLTLGMMTRTARGHTGRALHADHFEIASYVLVQAAAVVRVFGPLILPAQYVATVVAAGALWSSAFALYAARYWPVLARPRVDGKPG
ncbi:MAG TPA: NnrS family protein [Casimicrobiaceae bacterium]|nr:NnrS family protein [Casimicrobiaceae bacterium]